MKKETVKCCCNCDYNLPIYKKGSIVAHLCKYEMDEIMAGKMLADDCTDIQRCGRWKLKDE